MKKHIMAMILTALMILSVLAGCGTQNDTLSAAATTTAAATAATQGTAATTAAAPAGTTQAAQTQAPASQPAATTASGTESLEPITLTWLLFSCPAHQENFDQFIKDSSVYKELVERTGVSLDAIGLEADQVQVRIAGGDLGDLISVYSKDELTAMCDSELLLPLNDLVEQYAPDIKSVSASRWDTAVNMYPNDEGNVFALPVHLGSSGMTLTNGRYLYTVRWDLYKELGYPEIKDQYDLVEVLKDMVELQPTTPEGKKVYGASFYTSDTSYWGFVGRFYSTFGFVANDSDFIFVNNDTQEVTYSAYSADSPYWIAADYFNQCYRAGILDPDSFTMRSADFNAKIDAGETITSLYYNTKWEAAQLESDPASIKGYGSIPVDGAWLWNNSYDDDGWGVIYSLAIPKTSKYPERIMQFLNFTFSEEGARLLCSGVEGIHWEHNSNGEAVFTEKGMKCVNGGNEEHDGIYMQPLSNLSGFTAGYILSDGSPAYLGVGNDYLSNTDLTPCQKDYCSYYNCSWPNEHMVKRIENGEMFDLSCRKYTGSFGTADEDISRIDSACMKIALEAIPKAVSAPDDAAFAAVKEETIAAMESAGAAQALAFYTENYKSTVKEIEYPN